MVHKIYKEWTGYEDVNDFLSKYHGCDDDGEKSSYYLTEDRDSIFREFKQLKKDIHQLDCNFIHKETLGEFLYNFLEKFSTLYHSKEEVVVD